MIVNSNSSDILIVCNSLTNQNTVVDIWKTFSVCELQDHLDYKKGSQCIHETRMTHSILIISLRTICDYSETNKVLNQNLRNKVQKSKFNPAPSIKDQLMKTAGRHVTPNETHVPRKEQTVPFNMDKLRRRFSSCPSERLMSHNLSIKCLLTACTEFKTLVLNETPRGPWVLMLTWTVAFTYLKH